MTLMRSSNAFRLPKAVLRIATKHGLAALARQFEPFANKIRAPLE